MAQIKSLLLALNWAKNVFIYWLIIVIFYLKMKADNSLINFKKAKQEDI